MQESETERRDSKEEGGGKKGGILCWIYRGRGEEEGENIIESPPAELRKKKQGGRERGERRGGERGKEKSQRMGVNVFLL